MKQRRWLDSRKGRFVCGLLILAVIPGRARGEPRPEAIAAFNSTIQSIEVRLTKQHQTAAGFVVPLAQGAEAAERLHRGELIVERVPPSSGQTLPGAMLHHWRGTAFAPGARAAEFERLMRDFEAYPRTFSPQVLRATATAQSDNHIQAWMRVRQRHVITVVMDSSYDVTFGRLDAVHGYSLSRSTKMSEISSAGTKEEHALGGEEEHGFLWRQNTYWSYEERDGGLYMQIESVSLTRAIPAGLGWAVGPFVESVPRESLEFTLRSVCSALHR